MYLQCILVRNSLVFRPTAAPAAPIRPPNSYPVHPCDLVQCISLKPPSSLGRSQKNLTTVSALRLDPSIYIGVRDGRGVW